MHDDHNQPAISTRAPSIRSVASQSSIGSVVSLSRRPRTRTRSRTVSARPEDSATSPVSPSDAQLPLQTSNSDFLPPPLPRFLGTNAASSTTSQSSQDPGEATLVIPQLSPMPNKLSKAAKQASQLASIETSYKTPPSAFSRDPELTPNVRDSFSTNKSGTSSSFYPPSTSTLSATNSPTSPRTITEDIPQQPNIPLLTAKPDEMQGYDGDDVASRLRLLVNNNYFLPPAHMKPSPGDFAATMTSRKKPTTPNFLDIFRVGKSKTKSSTPPSPAGPILRTTSDSITAAYTLDTHSGSPKTPHASGFPINGNLDRGRVVVVRERMNDIAVAAKQAEQDIRTRNAKREHHQQISDKGKQKEVDAVIDPTDVVDVPLPSASYPFAVQASALHGLGVQESVGAAVLADRLPPSNDPNLSLTFEADHWRKALLHQAIHHSLDNTPDSTFSLPVGVSTPREVTSDTTSESSRAPTPRARTLRMQQRIASTGTSTEPKHQYSKEIRIRRKSSHSEASTSKTSSKLLGTPEHHDESLRSSYLPTRMVTPIDFTPLTPAPRKVATTMAYSLSQTDLQQSRVDAEIAASSFVPGLRRSISTPQLSEAWDKIRQEMVMTPIPLNIPGTRRSSQTMAYGMSRPSVTSLFSSNSHLNVEYESDLEQRGSVVLSMMNGRSSASDFSQASPTTSAFQDALNHSGEHSTASSIRGKSAEHIVMEEESRTRSSIASPPPRPSTSAARIALRPPPRSSSLYYPPSALRSRSTTMPLPTEPIIHISAPESPLSSPYAPASYSRLRNLNSIPLSLEIPTTNVNVHVPIHSPAPSSPTSFFDTIQTQPNAMDDLDSSDDSDDEDDGLIESSSPPPHMIPHSPPLPFNMDSRARTNSNVSLSSPKPSIMRLGNFSTPYLGKGRERSKTSPLGVIDSKTALGYTPSKSTFFSERKSDLGHGSGFTQLLAHGQKLPSGKGDSFNSTTTGSISGSQMNEELDKRRPATASQAQTILQNDRKPEALRRLDGLLLEHMEAEKDRMRKIASTLKASRSNS